MLIAAFLCGSLPFSVWLGKLFLRKDIRSFGDRNPGATNVFRAGSRLVGILALALDISKAAAPVGAAYFLMDIRGIAMFLIAVAPMFGHAFSPFLKFRGGKALATVLGIWIGLTLWKASLAAIVFVLIGIALFDRPGWAVMLALGGILVTLLIWIPDAMMIAVLVVQVLLQAWTHRADLTRPPHFRPWLVHTLHPAKG